MHNSSHEDGDQDDSLVTQYKKKYHFEQGYAWNEDDFVADPFRYPNHAWLAPKFADYFAGLVPVVPGSDLEKVSKELGSFPVEKVNGATAEELLQNISANWETVLSALDQTFVQMLDVYTTTGIILTDRGPQNILVSENTPGRPDGQAVQCDLGGMSIVDPFSQHYMAIDVEKSVKKRSSDMEHMTVNKRAQLDSDFQGSIAASFLALERVIKQAAPKADLAWLTEFRLELAKKENQLAAEQLVKVCQEFLTKQKNRRW
jgi:hypothetical protein